MYTHTHIQREPGNTVPHKVDSIAHGDWFRGTHWVRAIYISTRISYYIHIYTQRYLHMHTHTHIHKEPSNTVPYKVNSIAFSDWVRETHCSWHIHKHTHVFLHTYIHAKRYLHVYPHIKINRSLLQNIVSFIRLFCKRDLCGYTCKYLFHIHREPRNTVTHMVDSIAFRD